MADRGEAAKHEPTPYETNTRRNFFLQQKMKLNELYG